MIYLQQIKHEKPEKKSSQKRKKVFNKKTYFQYNFGLKKNKAKVL